jgi:hypothetical protein
MQQLHGQCCFDAAAGVSDVQLQRQYCALLQIAAAGLVNAALMRQLESVLFDCSGSHLRKFAAAGLVNAALMRQLEPMISNCNGSIAHWCKIAAAAWVNAALKRQLGTVPQLQRHCRSVLRICSTSIGQFCFEAAATLLSAADMQQLKSSVLLWTSSCHLQCSRELFKAAVVVHNCALVQQLRCSLLRICSRQLPQCSCDVIARLHSAALMRQLPAAMIARIIQTSCLLQQLEYTALLWRGILAYQCTALLEGLCSSCQRQVTAHR